MKRFECDYLEGADAEVLAALVGTNGEQTPGYGEDEHCDRARALIRGLCGLPGAGVHFFTGGTQVNLTVDRRGAPAVRGRACAPRTGHINVHETGAIEATGPQSARPARDDGKSTPGRCGRRLRPTQATHARAYGAPRHGLPEPPHGAGDAYAKDELEACNAVTRACGLRLFIDGARLSYGLAAEPAGRPSLSCAPLRRVYAGRHQVRRAFRRSAGADRPGEVAAFPLPHQAAGRAAGQGAAAGRAVRGPDGG